MNFLVNIGTFVPINWKETVFNIVKSREIMKWICSVLILEIILVGCVGQPASPTTTVQLEKPCEVINGERPDKPAFKGIELYSRQTENGEWLFTILYGTNRNKTVHEAGSGTMDFEEVKQCFCRLADGENVFWMDSAYNPETGEMISLPKPPPAIIKDIQDGAETCGVNLDPD